LIMRTHFVLALLMVAVCALLLGILAATGMAYANGGCPATYTVQRGDTLAAIAGRFNISSEELLRLNVGRVAKASSLRPGQVLCVPASRAPALAGEADSWLAIEVTYQYTLTVEERGWNLTTRGGLVGKRAVYPLSQPVSFVSTTEEMIAALGATPPPVLLGVRNEGGAYTLVAVGNDRILTSLIPAEDEALYADFSPLSSGERKRCLDSKPVATLGGSRVLSARATVLLEREGRTYDPFDVTRVDFIADPTIAARCYSGGLTDLVDFAMVPASAGNPNEYRFLLRVRPTDSQLAIEIRYALSEKGWDLTGPRESMGKRVVYPIQSVEFVSTTNAMTATLLASPPPVLLAVRNGADYVTYTLIAIGDERILTSLAITEPESLAAVLPVIPPEERERLEKSLGGRLEEKLSPTELQTLKDKYASECWRRPVQELGGGLADAATATILLENAGGVYYPFEVTSVVLRPNLAKARECYGDNNDLVGFALFPADAASSKYRLVIRLEGERIGPPGEGRALRCRHWPSSGWFYGWLRSWYGCPW
jgi:LysM repeat protein